MPVGIWMRCCGAGVLGAVLAASRQAAAVERFDVPDGCGTAAAFSQELERLLGARAGEAEPRSIEITGPDSDGQFTLRLELARERRALGDRDCRTLFRSAVVIAAAAYERDREQPQQAVAPEEPIAPAPLAWHAELGAAAGAGAGVVPGVAPTFELRLGAGVEIWRLALAGRYVSAREVVRDNGDGVDVSALAARVVAGAELGRHVLLNAGLSLYRLSGQGLAVPDPRSDRVWVAAPVLELVGIPLRLEHVRLEISGEVQLSLSRPRFVVQSPSSVREVYRVPRFGGAALFGASWLFM